MNGLSPDTDLSFLMRQRLEDVQWNTAQALLRFTGGVEISIEGDCLLDGNPAAYEALRSLAGKTVFGVTIPVAGTVNIFFQDGERLSLLDSNESFESYQLTAPGIALVV